MLNRTYPIQKKVDDGRLEDVAQRYPVEEPEQRLQSCPDERRLLCLLQDLRTEFEDFRELAAHLVLQIFDFRLSHLLRRVIEDLFRE